MLEGRKLFKILQEAVQENTNEDRRIKFHLSDGVLVTKSIYLKLHSKFISDVLSDNPLVGKDYHVIMKDVTKDNLQHLLNLISEGSSSFNRGKLDNVDR